MSLNSIPASEYVTINPSVLAAAGNAPSMSGLCLDSGQRVPIGSYVSFPTALAVAAYFGANSTQYADAVAYFSGFTIKTQTPGAMLFVQYPWSGNPFGGVVPAWLRGGSGLTLAQVQGLAPGVITIAVDGQTVTSSSINLSTASSLSNAAALITTGLGANDASVTAAIAPASAALTGVLASGVLTASAVTGPIVPGAALTGTGVNPNTTIVAQITGTAGGAGTYSTNGTQSLSSVSMTAANAAVGVMTVSAVASGTLAIGQTLATVTSGFVAGSAISGLLTGTGGTGTYTVNNSQTVASGTITAGALVCTYDSVAAAFVITGGTPGATGAIAYPTTNTFTTGLLLTAATGAVLSQGAAAATPAAFMTTLVSTITQNFATWWTNFEPVVADKVAFSGWNSGSTPQPDQFAYVMDSTEAGLITTNDATTSLGLITAAGYGGTCPNYQPSYLHTSSFVAGYVASINYGVLNGAASPAYKSSAAITPGVTNVTAAANLYANGCNYYGNVANPTNQWQFYYPGFVTGPYKWLDDYVNQIWLNQSLQTAIMTYLVSVNRTPYNQPGYDQVRAACLGPVNQAITNGVIESGVVLTASQVLQINTDAGNPTAAQSVYQYGWYLQIGPATPAQRVARTSPPCSLWYTSGGSINQINLASILVQ